MWGGNSSHCVCWGSGTGCPEGQAEWGHGEPDFVGGSPACGRGLELGDLRDPFQPKAFCDSMTDSISLSIKHFERIISLNSFKYIYISLLSWEDVGCACHPERPSVLSYSFADDNIFYFNMYETIVVNLKWSKFCNCYEETSDHSSNSEEDSLMHNCISSHWETYFTW